MPDGKARTDADGEVTTWGKRARADIRDDVE
jgi:hypothetical protein